MKKNTVFRYSLSKADDGLWAIHDAVLNKNTEEFHTKREAIQVSRALAIKKASVVIVRDALGLPKSVISGRKIRRSPVKHRLRDADVEVAIVNALESVGV